MNADQYAAPRIEQYVIERHTDGWIAMNRFSGVPAWDEVFPTRGEAALAACFEVTIYGL
tara:strand:- start:507 stop:683 length:177 start_codon:yes stop_codon:yes gene_type:complete